jgi:hypothetical protein
MKKALVAVATVAALGAGTISNAQAQEEVGPFIAGAVIGTVVGVVIGKHYSGDIEPPIPSDPPPRVVVVERPVVIKQVPPRHVHPRHHRAAWGWHHGPRRDWR